MAAAKSVCFNIVGAVFYMLLLIVVLTENRPYVFSQLAATDFSFLPIAFRS